MNVKRLLFTLACLAVMTAVAQEKSVMKVEYVEKYHNWTDASINSKKFLLLAPGKSHYYSPIARIVDLMLSTPEGTEHFNGMVHADNERGERPSLLPDDRTYVIKDFSCGSISFYGEVPDFFGHYEESMTEQHWTLTDSTATILGYKCNMAQTDYHGRRWHAWFTPEIPFSDGPWKFCGLPGLILLVTDSDNKYRLEATVVDFTEIVFPVNLYGHENSRMSTRLEMLRNEWEFYNFPHFGLPAELPDGFDLIETDYK
ncbi:MAG: GLPGLI family protein [Bacteroidales bacterium]|nr:GLPGLI family protein [Bacteroidales bacterium]